MNKYETRFTNNCPTNGLTINYHLVIEYDRKILVEDLTKFLNEMMPTYHETIADKLVERFGGKQTLRALHHGVLITTERERWFTSTLHP
jgi:hypothetical protein